MGGVYRLHRAPFTWALGSASSLMTVSLLVCLGLPYRDNPYCWFLFAVALPCLLCVASVLAEVWAPLMLVVGICFLVSWRVSHLLLDPWVHDLPTRKVLRLILVVAVTVMGLFVLLKLPDHPKFSR